MLAYLAFGNTLLLLALFVFTSGFLSSELFPHGIAALSDDEAHVGKPRADSPFNRVVFLLVDALRPDFVYGTHSGFNFTQGYDTLSLTLETLLSAVTTGSSEMAQRSHSQLM